MDWSERVSVNPEVMGGNPVIRGTRVPVQVVVGALAGGETVQDVCEGYRIEPEDVRAALAYAAEAVGYASLYRIPG